MTPEQKSLIASLVELHRDRRDIYLEASKLGKTSADNLLYISQAKAHTDSIAYLKGLLTSKE